MSDSYLEVAERILRARGRPLSAREILQEARTYGLLPSHLGGATMHKTLQARITEEIQDHREGSIFYRPEAGKYYLRELAEDLTLPEKLLKETTFPGNRNPALPHRVLFSNTEIELSDVKDCTVEDAIKRLTFNNWYEFFGNQSSNAYCIGTFTILAAQNRYLFHRAGRHTFFEDTYGRLSLGLRRLVDEFDNDLFGTEDFGTDFSAAREVIRNLRIAGDETNLDDRLVRQKLVPVCSVIEHAQRREFFVMRIDVGEIADQSLEFIRRLGIRQPQWLEIGKVPLDELDDLSRHLIKSGFL